jgi:hypothetical protein
MAQSIVFHNAADQACVAALSGALQQNALRIAGPVPGAVQFGARVIVVWSQHAAADYQGAHPAVPENAVVIQLDQTPLPTALAGVRRRMAVTGNAAQDADRLSQLLTGAAFAPAPSAAAVERRGSPKSRPVAAVRRRQAQSASMVTAAGAMGTLAAFALGAVVPADQLVTPSFAETNPMASPADRFERHEHLAETRQLAAEAQFQGVTSANGVAVTFSAEELTALNTELSRTEQVMAGARGWSDQAMARLQSLSASEAAPMPAMAGVPQPNTARMAAAAPPPLAQAPAVTPMPASASQPSVLRDRFAQVEPVAYAVDRLGEVLVAPAAELQPLSSLPSLVTEG